MKRILTLALVCMSVVFTTSAQQNMRIKLFDGSVLNLMTSQIEEITFDENESEDTDNDPDQPTVTGDATDITYYTATITGFANNILDNEATDLKVGIIYCTSGTPNRSNGTQRTVNLSSVGADGKYTLQLTNLQEGTLYYYRSFVYQSGLWFYGKVKEFRTKTWAENITFHTGEASSITCFSAKVSAGVTVDGSKEYSSMSWGICYGTTAEPTQKLSVSTRDAVTGSYTAQLRALNGSTVYYYRPYAVIDGTTFYGQTSSFQTKADNVCQTGEADEDWNVSNLLTIGGGAYSKLELGVCYSKDSELPTVSDNKVTTIDVDDDGYYTVQLPIKTSGTWSYRAYVLIDGSAHYGGVKEKVVEDGEPKTFTVNGVSFTMIPVQAGKFQMGSMSGYDDEKPVHSVTITKDYYIGETEVTQALWKAVTGYTPTSSGSSWSSTYGIGDNYPAYYISYEDVQSFITKLNSLTGATFRMPTEAEWEYAARGGNKSQGYTYSGSNIIGNVAWYTDNSGSKTHAVKTKAANELGIYDMSGNVWEWCSDWYGSSYYSSSPSSDPTGPTSGSYRVGRGGSWPTSSASGCRAAARYYRAPLYSGNYLGVRLALSSSQE